jgi:hypothetical protein
MTASETTTKITKDGYVFVGRKCVGRVLDARPHSVPWSAIVFGVRAKTGHFSKRAAIDHVVNTAKELS